MTADVLSLTSPGAGTGAQTGPQQQRKLRVFISYSRADLAFADQLDAALDVCGFDCTLDRQGISGGEDWKTRLGALLREAETVVFVLSPDSAKSPICEWEVETAAGFGKRIVPIVCRPLENQPAPKRLADLNYIFFYPEPKSPGAGFGAGLAKLVGALDTDLDWLREHTRYLQRATEWASGGKQVNRLLSGGDIAEAKAWVARKPKGAPEPTGLHLDYILASEQEAANRASAERRQLDAMAAAQTERQTALERAEQALAEAAFAQKRRARVRNVALVAVSCIAVVAGWQWWLARQQRILAEQQKTLAETRQKQAIAILERANDFIVDMPNRVRFDDHLYDQANAVFEAGLRIGHLQSLQYLAESLRNGWGSAGKDPKKAMTIAESAFNSGVSGAAMIVAEAYQYGDGVNQDLGKAREWYEKGASKGDAGSMRALGEMIGGEDAPPADAGRARQLIERAASLGDHEALRLVAERHETGNGVDKDVKKAVQLYERAAAAGDRTAAKKVGDIYVQGELVERNYETARKWYEQAAARNVQDAMVELGVLYANGRLPDPEGTKSKTWLERSTRRKGDAAYSIGVMYETGDRVPRDHAKAREWYEQAVDFGYEKANMRLGYLANNGLGGPKSYELARRYFDRAVAARHADVARSIAMWFIEGDGVERDVGKAKEWLEKAVGLGDRTAMVELGYLQISESGDPGYARARELFTRAIDGKDGDIAFEIGKAFLSGDKVGKNGARAVEWLERAAELGHVEALVRLGIVYHGGEAGIGQDHAKARQWYEKAAAKDKATAMLNLGVLYEHGLGVREDVGTAIAWYEKAAAKGDLQALESIGLIHYFGKGDVAQDFAKARKLFEQAAEKGHAGSTNAVGIMTQFGQGGPVDLARGHELLVKAAEAGATIAMTNLADNYAIGFGVSRDPAKAREWLDMATADGNEDAKLQLERFAIDETAFAGRPAEALQTQAALTQRSEAEDVKKDGKPGDRTVEDLGREAMLALMARDPARALAVVERGLGLFPDALVFEAMRAHALVMSGRAAEAAEIHRKHKGKLVRHFSFRSWEQMVELNVVRLRLGKVDEKVLADIAALAGVR
jgi:hypothetical protein